MSHYYDGPWRNSRSRYGLALKVGTKVSTYRMGKGAVLFTEYVWVPSLNVGLGLSGPGGAVAQALAVCEAILSTARRSTG
jgi:hypothetical protein